LTKVLTQKAFLLKIFAFGSPIIYWVSATGFELAVAPVPSIDAKKRIFSPSFDQFTDQYQNFFLYKFVVSLRWAQVRSKVISEAVNALADQDLNGD